MIADKKKFIDLMVKGLNDSDSIYSVTIKDEETDDILYVKEFDEDIFQNYNDEAITTINLISDVKLNELINPYLFYKLEIYSDDDCLFSVNHITRSEYTSIDSISYTLHI